MTTKTPMYLNSFIKTSKDTRRGKESLHPSCPYRIPNPFRYEEENCLPNDLKTQLLQLEYLSSDMVELIQFVSLDMQGRRVSLSPLQLNVMERAAKKQEERLQGIYLPPNDSNTMQNAEMTMQEDFALGIRHFQQLDGSLRQQLTLFDELMEAEQECYPETTNPRLHEDYESYFNN